MLGAIQGPLELNGQADDATKRTIRSYCLGQYAAGDNRVRDVATSYITLVWSDTDTGHEISTGVCIYASASDEAHKVLGCFVVHDIGLTLGDHLETVDGVERPRDWKSFRTTLQMRSERVTGERDIFFEEGKHFQRALLDAVRGGAGAAAPEAFTRAFRFALCMRFKRPVDHIVRRDILEPRRIDIDKFRKITSSFRELSQKAREVDERIAAGRTIAQEYAQAIQEEKRAVTWRGLQSRVAAARATNRQVSAITEVEETEGVLQKRKDEAAEASRRVLDLSQSEEQLNAKITAHAAHKELALAQQEHRTAEQRSAEREKDASALFGDAARLLRSAAKNEDFAALADELKSAAENVDSAIDGLKELNVSDAVAAWKPVREVALKAANLLLNGPLRDANRNAEKISDDIETAKAAIERAGEGKAPLEEGTNRLRMALVADGLSPIPVCDVTKISDPDWRPVIEGYLKNNAEALLVEADEEAKAFSIYRSLDARQKVFGVKIAQASKQSQGAVARPNSVAALIEGTHPAAVAFLRRQFGDLMCADSDAEALAGNTLTRDGMLVKGGAFERIALRREADLKIGIKGSDRLSDLKEALSALTHKEAKAKKRVDTLNAHWRTFTEMSGEAMLSRLQTLILNMIEARTARDVARALLTKGAAADYLALVGELSKIASELPAARMAESDSGKVLALAEDKLNRVKQALAEADAALLAAQAAVDTAQQAADFDVRFAAERWDALLSRYDTDFDEMHAACGRAAKACEEQVSRITNRASNGFGEFLVSYQASVAPEIREDWRQCHQWLTNEIARLERTELHLYKTRADEAYAEAQKTFRMDVATRLSDNLDWLKNQVIRLNSALERCPAFSNGERYKFVMVERKQYKELKKFVEDVAAYGPQEDLLQGAGKLPPEFESLMHDKATSGNAATPSPLEDYREFYDFDIEIRREDPIMHTTTPVGFLSERLGTASGGEHRAPLYVIAGAALASAYRMAMDGTTHDGARLILLDEAFDKMDATNLVATMRYLENLGLQVVLASPGENKAMLEAFLDRYYDVLRDPVSNTLHIKGHDVTAEARELLRADLPEFHPELIDRELILMAQEMQRAA
jgi:hypothetical protein